MIIFACWYFSFNTQKSPGGPAEWKRLMLETIGKGKFPVNKRQRCVVYIMLVPQVPRGLKESDRTSI